MNNYLILDTETTGLNDYGNDEIVEIAIIDQDENILLNTLIKPKKTIPKDVISIHGINNKMVKNAPTFKDIYPQLREILSNKNVFIYNKSFDNDMIKTCLSLDNLQPIKYNSRCVMLAFAKKYGEWSDYFGGYKWQKLTTAYLHYYPEDNFNLFKSSHRALTDCLMTSKVIRKMRGLT